MQNTLNWNLFQNLNCIFTFHTDYFEFSFVFTAKQLLGAVIVEFYNFDLSFLFQIISK